MPEEALLVLAPLGLMIAGLAILWAQARRTSSGRAASEGRAANAVWATGWVLLWLGLSAAVGLMTHVFFVLAWIVTAVILFTLSYRYRGAERRSLLWAMMLAAERGIPLETAARAFAQERRDHIGSRALDLAEYLEAGLPLALALKRSKLSFPHAVLLAAELGQRTGNLGSALRQALGQTDESEVILLSVAERAFYLVFLILFGLALWTFLMIRIVPEFHKIFQDFACQLPPVTVWLVGIAGFLATYWPLVLLLVVLLLAALLRSLSYYTGTSLGYLPGLSSRWQSADRSVIMRWLALAVRQNRPLPDMMRLIAGYLTRRGLRRKLEWAAKRVEQGASWTDCLRKTGLIRASDAAVFRSAQRAGNLAWALEEMAESSARRSIYRLRALVNVIFPVALLALGGSVLFVVFAILAPLFQLIQELA